MKQRTYPNTDLTVSEVGFGVWTLSTGWWGERSDEEACDLLRKAFDCGITFFDTADTYGNGRGETLLPKALKDHYDRVVIATKFGYDFYHHGDERRGQQEIPQDFSPAFVRFACEQSLERLEKDCIDLYQVHNARLTQVQDDDLHATLEDLKAQGKIQEYGIALGPAIGWIVEGIAAIKKRRTKSVQMIYNILEQYPGNRLYAAASAAGGETGFLIRVPHSSGMLEGKYTQDTVFPPHDHRRHRPRSWLLNGLKKLEALKFVVENYEMTLGQAAIKFILSQPLSMSALPNIYNEEQLAEFAAAPDTTDLSDADVRRIVQLYEVNFHVEEPPMEYKGLPLGSPEAQAVLAA